MAKMFQVNWPDGLKLRTEPEPTHRTYTGIKVPHHTLVEAIGEPYQYDAQFAFQQVRTSDGRTGWLTYRDGSTIYLIEKETKPEEEERVQVQPKPEPEVSQPKVAVASDIQYSCGIAYQHDQDNPVRPAYNHADKNIKLRGYTPSTDPGLKRELVDYGSGDPTQPPQFATLFKPHRVPNLTGFYSIHNWNWGTPPEPGSRSDPNTDWPVTALGLQTTPGEALCVPISGYDIGAGMEVIVIFADEDTITLKYTRQDSASQGYTVHVTQIRTDPNLLALYRQLDAPNGPRYVFPNNSYELPNLPAGQPFGTAQGTEIVVAIVDTGGFMDPRSCNEWWQIRPGYTGACPPA